MVKAETRKFVEEHRGLLIEVASRNESPVAPLAAALLISVPPEDGKTESSGGESPGDSQTDSAELDEILEKGVEL